MTDASLSALTPLLTTIEVLATAAFALSGLIEAARKRLDVVGVCVVAGISAFGGGTLRDLLLMRRPLFWVEHSAWIWALLALCLVAMVALRGQRLALTERAMLWPDALGLGLFSAGGAQIALQAGMPAIVAVILGVVTACFGGVLRDIVCNEIPKAFNDHRPYALCAFAGGWMVVAAQWLALPDWTGLLAAAVVATGLRVAALVTGYQLPRWTPDEPCGSSGPSSPSSPRHKRR